MTATRLAAAKSSRATHLASLALSFPFWLFDADQPAWPRKLSSIPPGSRPARLTGWYTWPWEYGTDVRRIDDGLPPGVTRSKPDASHALGSVEGVLSRLRYDDQFEPGTFRVVYEAGAGGGEEGSRGVEEWVWEAGAAGYVAARRVERVERVWDGVPVWDRGTGWNVLGAAAAEGGGGGGAFVVYGVASLVRDDAELLRATGVDALDGGEKVRKAQLEFLDEEGGQARGVVYPGKNQKERGLYITRGPEFAWNKRLLSGTALEGAPWSDVEDYIRQKRNCPLV